MIEIKRLPSGFYAVFVNGSFVNAALPSEQAAQACAADIEKRCKK